MKNLTPISNELVNTYGIMDDGLGMAHLSYSIAMDSRKQNPYNSYYYSSQRLGNHASSQHPQTPPAPHRRRHRWLRRLFSLLVVVALIIGGFAMAAHYRKPTSSAASITSNSKTTTAKKTVPVPVVDVSAMQQAINGVIDANSNIDFSVSVTDVDSGQSEHYGDSSPFTAASVGKLITATDFLHQVETGDQTLNETIDGNTAQYELQQMIVISDDDAWEDLNDQLSYANLQTYAQNLGLNSYQALPNTISSDDVATLLTQLYQGKLLNTSDTNLLLSWMEQANYREYIVPAVPSGDTIYHKIGLYEDFVNDAAIITKGQQAVVLVIFTNGNGAYNWPARANMMQQITKAVLSTYLG